MLRFLLGIPSVRSLHDRQLLFPFVVVVAAVLVYGALDRAAQAEHEPPSAAAVAATAPAPPAPTRPALRGDLEKTPLTYFADYWAQLANEVGAHLVAVGPLRVAGVVFEPGVAVTTVDGADALDAEAARIQLAREATESEESTRDAARSLPAVRSVDRELGLAVIEINATVEPFETASVTQMPSGSYLGAVSRSAAGTASIAPGYLVSAGRPPDAATPGGDLIVSVPPPAHGVAAVVDLDGARVGITFHAPDGPRALSVTGLRLVMDRMQQVGPCRAIVVSEMSDDVLALLGIDTGVAVAEVVADAFTPEPSLRPGDVLLEWAGEPVTSVDRFRAQYDASEAGTIVRYRVVRGRRRVSGGTVLPDTDCRADRLAAVRLVPEGMALRWQDGGADDDGWLVETVGPGGRADAAGVMRRRRPARH